MTTHTDRIRQMAQEAGFSLHSFNAIDGDEVMAGEYAITDDLTRFAQLVAEDCARVMRFEFSRMSPTIAEAANQGDSIKHIVEVCAAAAAFNVHARYSLKD